MSEYSNSAMIAWPVEFSDHYIGGPNIPNDLHCTVIYLGEFGDQINYPLERLTDALAPVREYLNAYVIADITDKEMFGLEKNIPVLRLNNWYVDNVEKLVNGALGIRNIKSGSSFPEYKAHITVDIDTWNAPPKSALLRPPVLYWGDEQIPLVD